MANRRRAFAKLRDAEVVEKLFGELGPRFKARPGGYTRILHMAPRAGDNADMALMALVDQAAPAAAEAKPADEGAKKPKARKKKAAEPAAAGAEAAAEAPAKKPRAPRKKKAAAG